MQTKASRELDSLKEAELPAEAAAAENVSSKKVRSDHHQGDQGDQQSAVQTHTKVQNTMHATQGSRENPIDAASE